MRPFLSTCRTQGRPQKSAACHPLMGFGPVFSLMETCAACSLAWLRSGRLQASQQRLQELDPAAWILPQGCIFALCLPATATRFVRRPRVSFRPLSPEGSTGTVKQQSVTLLNSADSGFAGNHGRSPRFSHGTHGCLLRSSPSARRRQDGVCPCYCVAEHETITPRHHPSHSPCSPFPQSWRPSVTGAVSASQQRRRPARAMISTMCRRDG